MRCPRLKAASLYDIDTQVDISVACCVTHNFIRLYNGDMSLAHGATLKTSIKVTCKLYQKETTTIVSWER